jgi:hypothetical protein
VKSRKVGSGAGAAVVVAAEEVVASTVVVVVSGSAVVVVASAVVVDPTTSPEVEVTSMVEDASSNDAEVEMRVANVVDEPSVDVTSSEAVETSEEEEEGSAVEVVSMKEDSVAEDWTLEAVPVPDEATDEGDGLHTLASTAPREKSARAPINLADTIVTRD